MAHVSLREILAGARTGHYGIPNLWGGSVEMVIGGIAGAEDLRAPLCICYNAELGPQIPIEIGVPLIVNAAKRATVPVATILDHGADLETAERAIREGISSVMFDGSRLPYEENVRQTLEVVRVAHAAGVAVEAELGAVGGSAVETGAGPTLEGRMTDPGQAVDFVARTGVDALAISFGNCHGVYRGEPKLDPGRVRTIASLVKVPLVMHGASGLKDEDYGGLIDAGISKVNYYTAMSLKAVENLRAHITSHCGCHDVVNWNVDFFRNESRRLLTLFRCAGRAPEQTAGLQD